MMDGKIAEMNESIPETTGQTRNETLPVAEPIDLPDVGAPRFLQLSTFVIQQMFDSPIMKSGLYGWHKAFNGTFEPHFKVKGRMNKFDIIMVIIDRGILEHGLLRRVRAEIDALPEDQRPVVVASVDYGPEMWQDSLPIALLVEQLRYADHIFCSEPINCQCVEAMSGIKPALIRHPAAVTGIRALRIPKADRFKKIGTVIHAWEGNWAMPHMVLHEVGMENEAVFMKQPPRPDICAFFDTFSQARPYMDSLRWLASRWIYLESYNMMHTYGRTVVECAALGIPAVGCANVMAMRDLYPMTSTPAGAVMEQRALIQRLIDDEGFYDEVVAYAEQRVENYSYRACAQAILELISYGKD